MKHSPTSQVVSHVLLLTILFTSALTSASAAAMRADLTHVDGGGGFTKLELLCRMAVRTRTRAARLHSATCGGAHPATIWASPGEGTASEYLVHFSIGTPRPQPVALTLDTGSDLVWTQCQPCGVCFEQPLPKFARNSTTTITAVQCWDGLCEALTNTACLRKTQGCGYIYTYGDGSITVGQILRDTFTFRASDGKRSTVSVPQVGFGCGLFNSGLFKSNETGIAGFGRGPLSLPSQLKIGRFSYCFTTAFEPKISPVFLGAPDNIYAHVTGPVQSTPIIQNPNIPTLYYLSLKGITVGTTRLPIPESTFALKDGADGTGTIIDSGTSFTSFPTAVYNLIRSAFVAQVRLLIDNSTDKPFDLCFSTAAARAEAKKVRVPELVLHLEGADLQLTRDNYIVDIEETAQMCLMLMGSAGEMTIIGNIQQQNMHILYDLQNNKLLFAPAQCDRL